MVKHIILWKLKDNLEDPNLVKKEIKEGLEGLVGVIPGLVELHVIVEHISSSNSDLMLDSTFSDENALKVYANHPAHLEIANTYVRPRVEVRLAFDYIV